MSSGTLRVGVIGVGGIAGAHFPGWKQSSRVELTALADVKPEALARVGKEQGVVRLYEKPADLIADDDIDIVDICTPNMYHAPLAIAALRAGKHVICEKPLAPSPGDIEQMIEARDRSGKYLMTAQHFRFEGSAKALKAEIDDGKLGGVYHARAWFLRRAALPVSPTFVLKQHSGGGPCIDIGVHILDLTLWMMGHPKPITVSGVTQDKLSHLPGAFSIWGGAVPQEMDVEEFAAALVRFDNGATLILEVSWMLHHSVPNGQSDDMQMWLYGDRGGAHWPGNELSTANNQSRQLLDTKLLLAERGAAHALECIAFADAIATGAPSPVPAEQSLQVQKILDGLYRSASERTEIRL